MAARKKNPPEQPPEGCERLFEELSKTNNELARLHRELAQKNRDLEQANELVKKLLQSTQQESLEALRKSEEKYQTIADYTYDWELWLDPQGKLLYCSPSCERITGYGPAAFTADPGLLAAIIHPDDRAAVESHLREENRSDRRVFDADYRIVTRDGEQRWISHFCAPVFSSDGLYLGRRASNRDITERKQKEEALLKSEATAWALLNATADACQLLDPDGRILNLNETMAARISLSRTEAINKIVWDLLPEDVARARKKITASVFATGRPIRFKDRRGGLWLDNIVYPVKDSSSKVISVAVFSRDITQQKKTATELVKTINLLQETQRISKVGGWEYDLATGRVSWTDETYRIYGVGSDYDPGDIEKDLTFYHPEDIPALRQAVKKAVEQREPYDLELRFIRASGEHLWVRTSGQPVIENGTVVRLAGNFMDITEHKLVEAERAAEIEVLGICTKARTARELMQHLTGFFRRFTGCEAVGVRLREGEDYPYFETRGFTDEFVQAESRLCAVDLEGQLIRDSLGNPVIECMCGNIIRGRFDPAKPFFTKGGSFWSNCTTGLLAGTTEADRQARTRNRCNGEGYESVALIRLRWAGDTFGLLQFNDRRKNRFTARGIAHLETLADYIAITLSKLQADADLHKSEEKLQRNNMLLDAVNAMLEESLTSITSAEVAAKCLAIAEKVTGSEFGFVNELNAAERYDCIALTDPGWEACRMPESPATLLPRNLPVRGFGGRVVKEKQPLIVNDPESHPDRIPMPEGHPPIRCFLGVPLMYENRVMGLIALANKEGGYDQKDLLAVERLAGAFVTAYQRKRSEEWVRLNEARIETLLRLAELDVPVKEASDFVLEEATASTRSTIGFLGLMSEDERTMIIHAWSKSAMRECAVGDAPIHYPVEKAGSWGEAIRQKQPVIVNAYTEPHPGKRGLPEGHVRLRRFIAVPHVENEKAVAVIAAGNKENDYDEADVRQLRLLIDGLWKHIRRKKEEELIRKSLREKELLLREIHHRVKNNLSIVSSMLDLQADYFGNKDVLAAFQESKSRIASMALIHTMLYQSEDFARVDMENYTKQLSAMLLSSFVLHRDRVSVQVRAAGVSLDIDIAIPCGLMVNELFTNAVKYAFADERQGSIYIELTPDNETCCLAFSDNGVGLPADIDPANTRTLGLQLVHMLVRQLDGTIDVERSGGTKYIIKFKI